MRKKYICILVAVIGVCSLSGCGSSAKKTDEEQVTIGVVTKSKSSEYWLSVCDGMKDAAEKYDPGSSENRYPGDGSFSYRFL